MPTLHILAGMGHVSIDVPSLDTPFAEVVAKARRKLPLLDWKSASMSLAAAFPVQIALEESRSLRELGLANGASLRLEAGAKKRDGAGTQAVTVEAFRAQLAARLGPARRPSGRTLGQGTSFPGRRGRRPPGPAPTGSSAAMPRPVWELQRFVPLPSCTRHRAWPHGLCDNCAPRPVLLVPQALLPDWAASRFRSARALLLYGQRRQREGGAGVEVELGAAYRPKQRGGEGGGASVERDPLLPAADAAARALGLVRVGWAVAEGAEQRTGGQRHSAAFAARLQSAFPDADAPPRSVASRFVTVSLRGDADTGRVDVRAWQVSDQTAALARDGLLTAGAKDGGSAHRDGVAAEAGSEGLLPVQGAGSPHVAPLRVATRLPRDALLALAAGEAGEADTVAAATAAAAAPTPAPGVPLSLALVPVPVVGDAAEAAPDTTRAAWLWEEGPDVPVTHVVAGAADRAWRAMRTAWEQPRLWPSTLGRFRPLLDILAACGPAGAQRVEHAVRRAAEGLGSWEAAGALARQCVCARERWQGSSQPIAGSGRG